MLARLKTIIALMRNPKVSKFPKFLVAAAILYLLMPFDAIPDMAPVVGWLDDIVFLVGAISLLFNSAPGPNPVKAPSGKSPARNGAVIDVTPEPTTPESRP